MVNPWELMVNAQELMVNACELMIKAWELMLKAWQVWLQRPMEPIAESCEARDTMLICICPLY